MSDQLILGFDTSAAHCAGALLRGDRLLAARAEEMSRGQAERLMGLLEEVLAEGGATWADLSALGVGVGPGNFTGIRISVAAARGLALALDIPAHGIDGFAARRWIAGTDGPVGVPAPRDHVWLSESGTAGRQVLRAEAGALPEEPSPAALAEAIARLAAERPQADTTAPAPLYLRAADAAPASDRPPALLD